MARVRWLAAAVQMTVLLLHPAACAADGDPAGPLRLELLQLTSEPFSGLLTRFKRPVSLQLRVTNETDSPLLLECARLKVFCEDELCRRASPSRPRLFMDEPQELAPGETVEGWVAFRVNRSASTEPPLRLSWEIGDAIQSISLNQVLRDLVNCRVVQVGYENRISILSIDRSIDLMTLWVLDEQFRSLRNRGVERLVLNVDLGKSARLPPKISNWLQLANRTAMANRRVIVRGFPAPVQFGEFHVCGYQYGNSSTGSIMHQSLELAVAAAARTLYERLPTAAAAAQLDSTEAGIRRAAMESCIDRLSSADLSRILSKVESGFGSDRQLVLELLDRVSNPLGLQALRATLLSYLNAPRDTSVSFASATAAVAAETLVRCIGPQTEAVLAEVWAAAHDNESIRTLIIEEVLRTRDYRWVPLAADFAAEQLDHFSADQSKTDTTTEESKPRVRDPKLLRNVLQFLYNNDPGFVVTARQRLQDVTSPDIQDELLRIVVDAGEFALARECITKRLDHGVISKKLLAMIHRLPDSQWTSRLLELQSNKDFRKRDRAPTLMAAVRCATDEQLDIIIDDVDSLDQAARSQLFRQLITMNHPRCVELLKKSLDGKETEFSTALRSLTFGMSPEILQLVVNRYDLIRHAAIERGTLEGTDYRMAATLLAQLGQIDHPEARRMINLSVISPEAGLRREAASQRQRSDNRSRTRIQKSEIWKLKKNKQYDAAMGKVNALIERDPFDAESLMIRASLNLRDDQVEAALADVVEANRLSPGDVITESTVALVHVRSGRVKSGIEYAEAVREQVPSSGGPYYGWTLYNTACVYGRAIELPDVSAADSEQFLERAIELMHQAADAGVHDEAHVLNDPDLVTLHNHPEWSSILDQITTNEYKAE